MIAKNYHPMKPELRAIREQQLNDFVVNEVSICSFIRLFRDLGYFNDSKADPTVLLALRRFEAANN